VVSAYDKIGTRKELSEEGGSLRGKAGDKKIFVQEAQDKLHWLSNVCPPLKLPIVGRTAMVQGKVRISAGN